MPAFTATLRKLLGSAKPIHTPLPPSSSFENVFQQWSLVDVPDNVKVTHINWPADKGLAFPAVQTFDLEAHAIIEDELTAFTNAFGTRAAVDIPAICVTEPEDDAELCALVNEVCFTYSNNSSGLVAHPNPSFRPRSNSPTCLLSPLMRMRKLRSTRRLLRAVPFATSLG